MLVAVVVQAVLVQAHGRLLSWSASIAARHARASLWTKQAQEARSPRIAMCLKRCIECTFAVKALRQAHERLYHLSLIHI
eukprot:6347552-Alexandrium_andersonii.AAC.1